MGSLAKSLEVMVVGIPMLLLACGFILIAIGIACACSGFDALICCVVCILGVVCIEMYLELTKHD